MSIILQQNPNLIKTGGFEKEGMSLFPNTTVSFSIPLISGQLIHGLDKDEVEKVEKHYGFSFTDPRGIEFYTEQTFHLPCDTTSLNIEDNPQDLLRYKLGLYNGFIAENFEATKGPMTNAMFFVYNAQTENKEKAKDNRIKAKIGGQLNTWFEDDPEYLINVGKYLFETYSVWTEETALNDILAYLEAHTSRNKNIYKVQDILNLDKEEVEFVVDVKEAISKSIIRKNTKGNYYNALSNTEFGKTLEGVLSFLKENPDELGSNSKSDSHYSIRKQLKS
jgi:hypothetical protein